MRLARPLVAAVVSSALLLATPALAVAEASVPAKGQVASMVGLDPAPSGLRQTMSGNRQVSLSWDLTAGATKYTVKVAVASNPDSIPSPSLGTVTYVDNNAKVGNLTNGVTYAFQVAATVNAKLTDYSAPVYGAPTPGEVPSNLHLVEIGNGAAYLDFDASDKATGYKGLITVVDAHGIANPLPGAAATSLPLSTLTATKLTNGVTYGFQVAAVVDGYNTDWSTPVVKATPQPVPNKMGTPSFGAITGSSVQVKWTAGVIAGDASAIDKYTVFYKPTAATVWQSQSVDAPALLATVDGLEIGVEYQFQTQATNSFGPGPKSVVVKTTPSNKPGAVLNLTANRADAGTSVNLVWTPPSYTGGASITKYTLTVAPKAGAVDVASSVSTSKATVTGLDPATDYKFTLTPYTSAGAGAASVVGSYAQSPGLTGLDMSSTGVVTLHFTPVANQTVTYQAQATQSDRLGSGAKVKNLQSVTTVTADKVTCASGACMAVFNKFADDIDGEAWSFRARTTDNINQYSNWATLTPPAPAAVDSVVTAVQADKSWSVKYTLDWASRTGISNFYSMTANGSPSTNGTISLGQYPGEVTVNLLGLGGTSSGVFSLPSPPVFNQASGGQVQDIANYNGTGQTWRVHTFTDSSALTVTAAPQPFAILLVGGGGSGGPGGTGQPGDAGCGGNGGDSAFHLERAFALSSGTYPVTIGGASQASRLSDVASADGGATASGTPGCSAGVNRSFSTSITGTGQVLALPGAGKGWEADKPAGAALQSGRPNTGDGGDGNWVRQGGSWGGSGGSGVIIVAYQIG